MALLEAKRRRWREVLTRSFSWVELRCHQVTGNTWPVFPGYLTPPSQSLCAPCPLSCSCSAIAVAVAVGADVAAAALLSVPSSSHATFRIIQSLAERNIALRGTTDTLHQPNNVVDAQYCFRVIDVGGQGRTSDGGILANSAFGQSLCSGTLQLPADLPLPGADHRGPQPHVFVGDEAFPLRKNLMRPLPGRMLPKE
ncbi:hypothetical protein ABVT39_025192 [Epinephelus coioides]